MTPADTAHHLHRQEDEGTVTKLMDPDFGLGISDILSAGAPVMSWDFDLIIDGEPSVLTSRIVIRVSTLHIFNLVTDRVPVPNLTGKVVTYRIYRRAVGDNAGPRIAYCDVTYKLGKLKTVKTDTQEMPHMLGQYNPLTLEHVYEYEFVSLKDHAPAV